MHTPQRTTLHRVPGNFGKPVRICVFFGFLLGVVAWGAGEAEALTEITIGVNTDTARAALRAVGGSEGRKIDLPSPPIPSRWNDFSLFHRPGPVAPWTGFSLTSGRDALPPPRWDDFTFPDGRIVALYSKPWELFPSIDRVVVIYVKAPSDKDYKKPWVKGTQVERFPLEKPPGEKKM
jgi:hypothetical protein